MCCIYMTDQMYHCVDIEIIYEVYDYAYLFTPREPRYRYRIHLNQIYISKVIVKNVFLHNGGSSFAYPTLPNGTMSIWIACLCALHLIECLYKAYHTTC